MIVGIYGIIWRKKNLWNLLFVFPYVELFRNKLFSMSKSIDDVTNYVMIL